MSQVYEDIVIDEEFSALLAPLSEAERRQLEQNIADHGGAREPIVVWETRGRLIILDGHNRYEICCRLGLPFDTHGMSFKSREDAADWIDQNQLGRRNLDPKHMSLLLGRRYNRTKKQGERTDLTSGQNVQKSTYGQNVQKLTTAGDLAEEHGVNEKTVRRDGEFAEAVEKLGLERKIASKEVAAPKSAIVEAAAALPDEASEAEVRAAAAALLKRPKRARRNSGRPNAGVDESLRKINEQIDLFFQWHPGAVGLLKELLEGSVLRCRQHKAQKTELGVDS